MFVKEWRQNIIITSQLPRTFQTSWKLWFFSTVHVSTGIERSRHMVVMTDLTCRISPLAIHHLWLKVTQIKSDYRTRQMNHYLPLAFSTSLFLKLDMGACFFPPGQSGVEEKHAHQKTPFKDLHVLGSWHVEWKENRFFHECVGGHTEGWNGTGEENESHIVAVSSALRDNSDSFHCFEWTMP